MASWCPLCNGKYNTDKELADHMPKCSYPKDKRKGGNGKK